MKKIFLLMAVIFSLLPAFGYTGTTIGPEVSELNGKKLQWGTGQFDYFVMFKSLMSNEIRDLCEPVDNIGGVYNVGCDFSYNPEPDTCLSSSTFRLTNRHIPEDALIEAAYLVWTVSVDPNNIHTDNTAMLDFRSDDGIIRESAEIAAPRVGELGTDADPKQQDFTFEGIAFENNGLITGGTYTYRVDITDFFNRIHAKGHELGYESESDGIPLYGNYTVSGIDCTNDQQYLSRVDNTSYSPTTYSSTVIAGWSIITVYRSSKVSPKMVYIYNGFNQSGSQYADLGISGFEFPDKPVVKITLAAHEGDPGFAFASGCGTGIEDTTCPSEGLQVTGETTPPESSVFLYDECNPAKNQDSDGNPFNYTETYNSISSTYGWQDALPTCVGGDPNDPDPNTLEYTMDVDTFLLDAGTNTFFDEQFKQGDTSMFIRIGTNRDLIYTNYMVVSVSTKNNWSDSDTGDTEPDTGDTDSADTDSADTADTADTADPDTGTSDSDPADSDSGNEKGNWGELNGECYPNGTCNEGLACNKKENICVKQMKSAGGCSVMTVY